MSEEKKAEGTEEITIVNVSAADGEKKLETELTFTMDWTNSETGKKLSGTFTAQRANIGMVRQIAVIKARLNGGERVQANIDFLNEVLAYCQVVLTDTPKWWAPETFFDTTPLDKVYSHVRSWEDSFRGKRVVQ